MINIIGKIVESMVAPVTSLVSEYIVDKDKAAELAFRATTLIATQSHDISLAQIEVNKTEAQTGSVWQGGWRPAAGWTCVAALANNFLIVPYAAPLFLTQMDYTMPVLDLSVMLPILLGMLGLSGMRTFEKVNNVAVR